MRLRTRFILIGVWIVVFLITTPVIVLFALGYKFDFENKQLIKTGSLVARSAPEYANIYIDDKLQNTRSNATIRFLLPGDYNVQLSKNGYQSWTKRLNVRSALVTWAAQGREFITLFFTTPEKVSNIEYTNAVVSLKEQSAITFFDSTINFYSTGENQTQSIAVDQNMITQAAVLNSESKYYFFRNTTAQVFEPELLTSSAEIQSNGQYAALLLDSNLYINNKGIVSLFAENITGYLLENDHIWYTQSNSLKRHSLFFNATEAVTALPYSPLKSQIIRGDSQLFIVLDQTAYALNDQLEEIYRGVVNAVWDSGTQKLVITNNNEALLFDPHSFRSELVIRSSTEIKNVLVNNTTGYMFFINEGNIKAIELDGRDHRNVYTLTNGSPEAFLLNENGRIMSVYSNNQRLVLKIR